MAIDRTPGRHGRPVNVTDRSGTPVGRRTETVIAPNGNAVTGYAMAGNSGTRTATPYTPKKTKKNQLKLSANAEVLRKPLGMREMKQTGSWASGPLGGQGGR